MKKLNIKKYTLLLPLVALCSCGYSLNYIVPGNKYNSPIFTENFYTHWDNELKNAPIDKNKDDLDYVTSFTAFKNSSIDPSLTLSEKRYGSADEYGQDYKLNAVDDLFNYGVQSKLFDGQVQCLGYYQLSRVQVAPTGFSVRFSKESSEINYIAMQFKTTTDNTLPCLKLNEEKAADGSNVVVQPDRALFHTSTFTLRTSIYTKNANNQIVKNVYSSTITNERTNVGSYYIFYAIDLKNENLNRVVGVSIDFDIDDELINWNESQGVYGMTYAMFLYEIFLPYTTWH